MRTRVPEREEEKGNESALVEIEANITAVIGGSFGSSLNPRRIKEHALCPLLFFLPHSGNNEGLG